MRSEEQPPERISEAVRESSASNIYGAWAVADLLRRNVSHPRWFALREDVKDFWRKIADSERPEEDFKKEKDHG